MFQSAPEVLQRSSRRIMVVGSPGTGKSTFSVSASSKSGDAFPRATSVTCDDIAVICGDSEGILGPIGAGLIPGSVLDLSGCNSWDTYSRTVTQAMRGLKEQVKEGKIRYLVVDLALPGRLISALVKPETHKEWAEVGVRGAELYSLFTCPGLTVIGNAQLKAAGSPGESNQAAEAGAAKAVGGERSTYTADLNSGIKKLWMEHSSLVLCREAKKVRAPDPKDPPVIEFHTHTRSGRKFEAKSRFHKNLKPIEPGEVSLNALLRRAYGEYL